MKPINPTDCAYYLVSRVTLSVTSALKDGFTATGVSPVKPAYLGVLMSLWQEDGLKGITLGQRAGLEPSTMTGLLDRMERDGLVERRADPNDRRAQLICLTEQGKTIREPVLKVVNATLEKVFIGISEEDFSKTKNVLRKILTNANEENRS